MLIKDALSEANISGILNHHINGWTIINVSDIDKAIEILSNILHENWEFYKFGNDLVIRSDKLEHPEYPTISIKEEIKIGLEAKKEKIENKFKAAEEIYELVYIHFKEEKELFELVKVIYDKALKDIEKVERESFLNKNEDVVDNKET